MRRCASTSVFGRSHSISSALGSTTRPSNSYNSFNDPGPSSLRLYYHAAAEGSSTSRRDEFRPGGKNPGSVPRFPSLSKRLGVKSEPPPPNPFRSDQARKTNQSDLSRTRNRSAETGKPSGYRNTTHSGKVKGGGWWTTSFSARQPSANRESIPEEETPFGLKGAKTAPRPQAPMHQDTNVSRNRSAGPSFRALPPSPESHLDRQRSSIFTVEDDRARRKRLQIKERSTYLQDNSRASKSSRQAQMSSGSTMPTRTRGKPAKKLQARRDVYLPTMISVANLSRLLGVRQGNVLPGSCRKYTDYFLEVLQTRMTRSGLKDISSYDHMLMTDDSSLLALEFGFNPIVDDEAAFDIHPLSPHPQPSLLPERPPIVTIMGHVDHGKTTLLDTLRSASVAKGEVGGITQHIGAFSVPVAAPEGEGSQRTITFLDTPGHAAFSAMRARGARLTDIIVLVVAADDGIMPQTREVINLIKQESSIGVVVAINKCDKPGIDVDKVQKQLLGEGIELEVFGGDIPSVEVSGLSGQGLDTLVETISVIAEVQELRAEREGPAQATIIESKVQKGLGPVATIVVQRGVLRKQSHVISGLTWARIRQITNEAGSEVTAAYPGMAVTVSGWKEVPSSGEEVLESDESSIHKALSNRKKRAQLVSLVHDAEVINEHRQAERLRRELLEQEKRENPSLITTSAPAPLKDKGPTVKELRLVIKADVTGSVEAVTGALEGIGNHQAKVKIVHTGVGDVSESDVMMAKAVEGHVIGFTVKTPKSVEAIAAVNSISIISSPIIYRLMEDVKQRVTSLLPIVLEYKVTGEATVLQLFDIGLKGKKTKQIGGCRGRNGTIRKSQDLRVVRYGTTVFEGDWLSAGLVLQLILDSFKKKGPVDTLKHHKTDIQEVSREMDFGVSIVGFSDLRGGDVLQSIERIELPGKL